MISRYRLVTLLEILEASAEAWWRLSSIIGQLLVRLEGGWPTDEGMKQTVGALGEVHREAERLRLRSVVQQSERIKEWLFRGNESHLDSREFREMVMQLHLRAVDELNDRFFLVIPVESIGYYKQPAPLFGAVVEAKFPLMSEDIAEAGRCLGLDRTTASVFHMMRVVEIGVQLFGNKLGVSLTHEKNWQNILDEVNKAIRALNQKDTLTKQYAAISAHLYNVKLAWRNEVMHPKQTYSDTEARTLFLSVATFVEELAKVT